jgi:hypothetical protein
MTSAFYSTEIHMVDRDNIGLSHKKALLKYNFLHPLAIVATRLHKYSAKYKLKILKAM